MEKECQQTGVLQFPIFMEKDISFYISYIINCGMHRCVKLQERAMKIFQKVLDKRLRKVVTIDDMQFGLMLGKGKIDAVFILRRIQ